METKAIIDADVIINLIRNHNKLLLFTGSLKLPFQRSISKSIVQFIMVLVHKHVRISERLHGHGIITPSRSSFSFHAVVRWSFSFHAVVRWSMCDAILRNCKNIISTVVIELRRD